MKKKEITSSSNFDIVTPSIEANKDNERLTIRNQGDKDSQAFRSLDKNVSLLRSTYNRLVGDTKKTDELNKHIDDIEKINEEKQNTPLKKGLGFASDFIFDPLMITGGLGKGTKLFTTAEKIIPKSKVLRGGLIGAGYSDAYSYGKDNDPLTSTLLGFTLGGALGKLGSKSSSLAEKDKSLRGALAKDTENQTLNRVKDNTILSSGLTDKTKDDIRDFFISKNKDDYRLNELVEKKLSSLSDDEAKNLHLHLDGDSKFAKKMSDNEKELYDFFKKEIDSRQNKLVQLKALLPSHIKDNYLVRSYMKEVPQKTKSVFDSSTNSIDKFMKRDDLSFADRQRMGQVQDARLTIPETLQRQNEEIRKFELMDKLSQNEEILSIDSMREILGKEHKIEDLAKITDSKSLFDMLPKAYKKRYAILPDNRYLGNMRGKIVTKTFKSQIDDVANVSNELKEMNWFMRAYFKSIKAIKINQTVLSVGTHVFNVYSNLLLTMLHDPAILKETKNFSRAYKEAVKDGIIGSNTRISEFMSKQKFTDTRSFLKKIVDFGLVDEKSKFMDKAFKVYDFGDSSFKAMAYSFYKKKALKEGLSLKEAKELAKKQTYENFIDNTTPLPPLVQKLDRLGIAPFIGFQYRATSSLVKAMSHNPKRTLALIVGVNLSQNSDDRALISKLDNKSTNIMGTPDKLVFGDKVFNFGRSIPAFKFTSIDDFLGFGYVGTMKDIILNKSNGFKRYDSSSEALGDFLKSNLIRGNILGNQAHNVFNTNYNKLAGKNNTIFDNLEKTLGLKKIDKDKIKERFLNDKNRAMKNALIKYYLYGDSSDLARFSSRYNSALKSALK